MENETSKLSQNMSNNPFLNNTFNIKEVGNTLTYAMENSFNYLKSLQRSYVGISRFNLTEDDGYINYKNELCFVVDKDFIDPIKRKIYKESHFYAKYLTIDEINDNSDIFTYIPVVLIDGEACFSFNVKSSLDGKTVFKLNHIRLKKTFLHNPHNIEIVFFRNLSYSKFEVNSFLLEKYTYGNDFEFPYKVTGTKFKPNSPIFLFYNSDIAVDNKKSTNFIPAHTNENGDLVISSDTKIENFLEGRKTIQIITLEIDFLIEKKGFVSINTRIDNGRKSSLFVASPKDGETYAMTIPSQNIIIIKHNKLTGEYIYENNKDVILHYPNFYEIMSDELSSEEYDYKIYYFYKPVKEQFRYDNKFKYIHRYLTHKICNLYPEITTMENSFRKMVYEELEDKELQKYFLRIFEYEDADYLYNHGDFNSTDCYPSYIEYKKGKMREFIDQEPDILREYAERTETETDLYYLYINNINLENRIRTNTLSESEDSSTHYYFEDERYVFAFRNDSSAPLKLRLYIDGLYQQDFTQIHVKSMDYIYIPTKSLTENSYIEAERFNKYLYTRPLEFNSLDQVEDLVFSKVDPTEPTPTALDFVIVYDDLTKVDKSSFKIYNLIDTINYNPKHSLDIKLKHIGYTKDDDIIEDKLTGELYLRNNGGEDSKLTTLTKMKIKCIDESLFGLKLKAYITKDSYISHYTMVEDGIPRLKVSNGSRPSSVDKSFIRVYINGRFVPTPIDLKELNQLNNYVVINYLLSAGDVVSVDSSPFSYRLVYQADEIPDDYIIRFENDLPIPFNYKCYDVYLNGKKLNQNHLQALSPNKIKLFNVKSRLNLLIYVKERDDHEFFNPGYIINTPIDDFLNSYTISDEDKEKLIEEIIHGTRNPEDVIPGTDEEDDAYKKFINEESYDEFMFYLDVIVPEGIARPNSFFIDEENTKSKYPFVYDAYKVNRRMVFKPNRQGHANKILIIGKNQDQIIYR